MQSISLNCHITDWYYFVVISWLPPLILQLLAPCLLLEAYSLNVIYYVFILFSTCYQNFLKLIILLVKIAFLIFVDQLANVYS